MPINSFFRVKEAVFEEANLAFINMYGFGNYFYLSFALQ